MGHHDANRGGWSCHGAVAISRGDVVCYHTDGVAVWGGLRSASRSHVDSTDSSPQPEDTDYGTGGHMGRIATGRRLADHVSCASRIDSLDGACRGGVANGYGTGVSGDRDVGAFNAVGTGW